MLVFRSDARTDIEIGLHTDGDVELKFEYPRDEVYINKDELVQALRALGVIE